MFLFAILLESKIPQVVCWQVENKGKSQCHEYERKEVAFPDTVMYSGLANFMQHSWGLGCGRGEGSGQYEQQKG